MDLTHRSIADLRKQGSVPSVVSEHVGAAVSGKLQRRLHASRRRSRWARDAALIAPLSAQQFSAVTPSHAAAAALLRSR